MVDWERIETVMLDMDGVLLDLRFDNFFWLEHVPATYAERHGLDLEQARREILPRYQAAEGTLDWYCIDHWSRNLGLDIAGLKSAAAHRIQVRPLVTEFLSALRELPVDVRLVTNAHRETLDIKMQRTGLAVFFDMLICSHDFAAPKESAAFWQGFHAQHPFAAQRSLFIDDSLPVLRSAQGFGVGELLAVDQPDSGQARKDTEEFRALSSFADIMPM